MLTQPELIVFVTNMTREFILFALDLLRVEYQVQVLACAPKYCH